MFVSASRPANPGKDLDEIDRMSPVAEHEFLLVCPSLLAERPHMASRAVPS